MKPSRNDIAFEVVSPEQRRDNSRAVDKRDRWRAEYCALSRTIRRIKDNLHSSRQHSASYTFELRMQLRIMANEAGRLMLVREQLAHDLKTTAYRYAPKAWIERPNSQG